MGHPTGISSPSLLSPGHLHANGNFVLDGEGEERRRVDLEVGERGWNGSSEVRFIALLDQFEWDLAVVGGLSSELDFQIGFDRSRRRGRLRQTRAHCDHGEFSTTRDLEHVQVAVAVAGIECLNGNGDEEVALSFVADALAAGGVAHAFALMQGMRDVVGQGAFLEDPWVVSGKQGGQWEQEKKREEFFVHRILIPSSTALADPLGLEPFLSPFQGFVIPRL